MMKIRKATCEDGPVVSQLLKERYSFNDVSEANEAYAMECSYQHFRLAEEQGRVVGLISWRPQGTLKHGVVELSRLAVSKTATDSEAVKELLFDVLVAETDFFYKQHGSRVRKIFSLIHADNQEVKDFYINKGMRQEAVLKNHFHLGTDELVFSLFLS